MRNEQIGVLSGACLALLLVATASQADADCPRTRAVTLEIDAGALPASEAALRQVVIAELEASRIAVCAAPPPVPGRPRVQISAAGPRWESASIRLEGRGVPALERELDASKLPPEARALAIASAADELVRSVLDDPGAAATLSPLAQAPGALSDMTPPAAGAEPALASAPAPLPGALDRSPASASAPIVTSALLELGLGAAVTSHPGQLEALDTDLLVRYWPLPRLVASAHAGMAQRLRRPSGRGEVQPGADVHAALAAGLVLWGEPARLALLAEAGLQLSRVGFDARRVVEASGTPPGANDDVIAPIDPNSIDAPRNPGSGRLSVIETESLDPVWALAASAGLEARVQKGAAGASLSLAALVPVVPARVQAAEPASLDAIGVQLRFSVWIMLGSRPAPADPEPSSRRRSAAANPN